MGGSEGRSGSISDPGTGIHDQTFSVHGDSDSEEKQMLLTRILNLELKAEAYGEKLASCEHAIDELKLKNIKFC